MKNDYNSRQNRELLELRQKVSCNMIDKTSHTKLYKTKGPTTRTFLYFFDGHKIIDMNGNRK